MSGRILKGLAVVAGTGFAAGFGSGRKRKSELMSNASQDDSILDRLDRIEARLSTVEDSSREVLRSLLETTLAPHVENLGSRLRAEMQESMDVRLTAFEQSIDTKVSARMATLEKAVVDQSAVITALSKRAVEAEENFQRLISAVERLCAQREAEQASQSGAASSSPESPFEKHLNEAFHRQPAPRPDPGFRPRIVSEEETKSQRRRRPMSGMR